MTICIMHETGVFYTNAESVADVVNDIVNAGKLVKVWWTAAHGQRFTEEMWFNPDMLYGVRTERDDG